MWERNVLREKQWTRTCPNLGNSNKGECDHHSHIRPTPVYAALPRCVGMPSSNVATCNAKPPDSECIWNSRVGTYFGDCPRSGQTCDQPCNANLRTCALGHAAEPLRALLGLRPKTPQIHRINSVVFHCSSISLDVTRTGRGGMAR